MQFADMLWWLAPLGGAIILLYLLKMRRRDVRVPAVFLWPKLTADVRANAPIQKLRITLLLILQLLTVILLVVGLANPLLHERGLRGRTTVLILDASASMGATDVQPTRFEDARKHIDAVIASLGNGDRCALIEAGNDTRAIFPLTSDKARMRAALSRLHATDSPNDMGEALRLAAALVGQIPGSRIVVFSDGSFPAVTNFSPGKASLLFEKIGTSSKNVAITAMDAGTSPDGSFQLFAGIHNYDSRTVTTTATFQVDGKIADSRALTIPAGQTLGQTLKVSGTARRADVQLSTPGDILPADDHASLYLQGAGSIHVLLVSPGDFFLERALALEPSITLDKAGAVPSTELAGSPGDGGYDLVIFDGVPALAVKAPAVWSFGEDGPGIPATASGTSQHPGIVAWKRDDPLLRYASLQNLLIEKAAKVQATEYGRVLATGTDGPLIIASDHGGRKALFVGWSLLDSDFPLRTAFPIFVDNAVHWLTDAGSGTATVGLNVHAGQPFNLPAPSPGDVLTLNLPDGEVQNLDTSSGVATVRANDRVGIYTVTGKSYHKDIAVNLLDETESDVQPRLSLDLSGQTVAAHTSMLTLVDTWRLLVLLAVALLALEWWVFVKRS